MVQRYEFLIFCREFSGFIDPVTFADRGNNVFIYLIVLFNVVLFVLYNSNPTSQLKVPQTQIQN